LDDKLGDVREHIKDMAEDAYQHVAESHQPKAII
jgi:hypothetical protein